MEEEFRKALRELIKQTISEFSGTAGVAGYNTPGAFMPPEDFKKKHKNTKYV